MDVVSYLLGKNSSSGGGGGLDWSLLGYENTPEPIINAYNYALNIKNNWIPAENMYNKFLTDINLIIMPLVDTSITTSMERMFVGCSSLLTLALLNTSNVTDMGSMFANCENLREIPLLNTSNVTNMRSMFDGCRKLENVPILDTSKVTDMRSMFSSCGILSDDSLNNILKMCINATKYTRTKTLQSISINSGYYPASKIEALSNYQDFIDAGWTIGY